MQRPLLSASAHEPVTIEGQYDETQEEREQDGVKATGPGAEADCHEHRHRGWREADPLPCRPGRLERRAEAEAIDHIDQLLHADLIPIERDASLPIPEAHLGPLHPLEPLQGPLDRNRSAASRHTLDSQHDRRGRGQGNMCEQERQNGGNPGGNTAPHCVTFLSMLFISSPAGW